MLLTATEICKIPGPNDKSRSVPLIARSSPTQRRESPRVYLCRAWNAFAKENGFQAGDDVFFWLRADSTFRILLCSPESLQRTTTTEAIEGDEDDGTSDGVVTLEAHASTRSAEAVTSEACAPTRSPEAVPPHRPTSNVHERVWGNYPGLNSAVSANSRFPLFLKKLTQNTLNDKRSRRMVLWQSSFYFLPQPPSTKQEILIYDKNLILR